VLLAVVIGNLSAPAAVSRIRSRTPVLLAGGAAATAAVTDIAALGALFGPAGEFVFLGDAVALGLLSGRHRSSPRWSRRPSCERATWAVGSSGSRGGVLVLGITAADLVLVPRPDSWSEHVSLIWLGAPVLRDGDTVLPAHHVPTSARRRRADTCQESLVTGMFTVTVTE